MEKISIKEKVILVFYVNVGSLPDSDIERAITRIKSIMPEDDHAMYLFIPVRNQETRVECVYPLFLSDDQIKSKAKEMLDRMFKKVKENE
ncbi:MAG: hypothetical protein KatS3mg035_1153 [Bacteroidia bacterium]|nr:MAG: hypothetical protein KatS3mg035_1153 [Bacteroidia bacterium]